MTLESAIHPTPEPGAEDLAEGGSWLLDLVAAVDHLCRGYRPGFTVWDALEEAVRWELAESDNDTIFDSKDPLATTLHHLTTMPTPSTADVMQTAVRRWVTATAHRYNNGHHWSHPASRRGFPPALL